MGRSICWLRPSVLVVLQRLCVDIVKTQRELLDDVLGRLADAQIELRITPSIWPFWRRVVESSGRIQRISTPKRGPTSRAGRLSGGAARPTVEGLRQGLHRPDAIFRKLSEAGRGSSHPHARRSKSCA
ncbi:MAG: DUF6886 family protein [Clostridia bacterium]